MRIILAVGALAALVVGAAAQNHHRHRNVALLGVVTAPAKKGAEILYVLAKSPAAKAKLAVGDVLVKIGKKKPKDALDPRGVDAALRELSPGDTVAVTFRRKKQVHEVTVKLMERKAYRGDFLKPRQRGTTGFKSPGWFVYAWANAKKGKEPTPKAAKGKVVVIHAFQSW